MDTVGSMSGVVEAIDPTAVSGWAASLSDPTEPLTLELIIAGAVAAETLASRPRPDLDSLNLGSINFGFRFDLINQRITSSPEVRVKGANLPLHVLNSALRYEGVVEQISWPTIGGWAWQVGSTNFVVDIDIFMGERLLRTVSANILRDHLAAAGIGTGAHGFELNLEDCIDPKTFNAADIRVLFHGASEALQILPSAIKTEDYLAAELTYERGLLRGWVHNNQTNQPQWIVISIDGAPIWSGEARRLEYLALSGERVQRLAGFRVQLPAPQNWTEQHIIAVRTRSGEHVPGSPLVVPFGDHFLGNVDDVFLTQDKLTIAGWCIDTTKPSTRVPLTVFYKGEVVLEGETHKQRADLSTIGFDAPSGNG